MRMMLLVLLCLLPVMAYAEDVEEMDAEAPADELPAQLWQPCYMGCLADGQYAYICEPICEYTDSKAPEKLTRHQYECYKSCISNQGWGAVFCLERCRGWGRTLDRDERELPPPPGV